LKNVFRVLEDINFKGNSKNIYVKCKIFRIEKIGIKMISLVTTKICGQLYESIKKAYTKHIDLVSVYII